jgi:hypothetical protein
MQRTEELLDLNDFSETRRASKSETLTQFYDNRPTGGHRKDWRRHIQKWRHINAGCSKVGGATWPEKKGRCE